MTDVLIAGALTVLAACSIIGLIAVFIFLLDYYKGKPWVKKNLK